MKNRKNIPPALIAVHMRDADRMLGVRLSIRRFRPVLDLRVFVHWDSLWRPSATGLAIEPGEVKPLIAALQKAAKTLKHFGLHQEAKP